MQAKGRSISIFSFFLFFYSSSDDLAFFFRDDIGPFLLLPRRIELIDGTNKGNPRSKL